MSESADPVVPADEAEVLRRVLDFTPGVVLVLDRELRIRSITHDGVALFGYGRDEALGRSVLDFIDPHWNPTALTSVANALASGDGIRLPTVFRTLDRSGDGKIVRVTANVRFNDPLIGGLVVFCEPWAEQWLLDAAFESVAAGDPIEETLDILVRVAAAETLEAEASFVFDPVDGHFSHVVSSPTLPRELCGPLGGADSDVLAAWDDLLTGDEGRIVDTTELPAALRSPAEGAGLASVWVWPGVLESAEAASVWAIAWRRTTGLDPQMARLGMMTRLVTLGGLALERSRTDERNRHAASHDAMTGLWNRNAVYAAIEESLAASVDDEGGHGVGVVYLDLDRFKIINDQYGHAAGDRVLDEIGRRLAAASPPAGRIGRFGGDEFVYAGPAADLDAVDAIASGLVAEILHPIQLRSGEIVQVGASTGTSFAMPGTVGADELVERADADLYRVKHARGGER